MPLYEGSYLNLPFELSDSDKYLVPTPNPQPSERFWKTMAGEVLITGTLGGLQQSLGEFALTYVSAKLRGGMPPQKGKNDHYRVPGLRDTEIHFRHNKDDSLALSFVMAGGIGLGFPDPGEIGFIAQYQNGGAIITKPTELQNKFDKRLKVAAVKELLGKVNIKPWF